MPFNISVCVPCVRVPLHNCDKTVLNAIVHIAQTRNVKKNTYILN